MSENRTYDSIHPSHTTLTAWPLRWGIKVRDIRPNLAPMLQPPHTPAGPAEAWLLTQKSVSAIGPRLCRVCLRNTWALYLHHVNLFYAWPLWVSPLSVVKSCLMLDTSDIYIICCPECVTHRQNTCIYLCSWQLGYLQTECKNSLFYKKKGYIQTNKQTNKQYLY